MKATMFFLMLFVGGVALGQRTESAGFINYYDPALIDTNGISARHDLEAVPDTVVGYGLVTRGDNDIAQQVFLYQIQPPFLIGRGSRVYYLDVYKRRIPHNMIVWSFRKREQ